MKIICLLETVRHKKIQPVLISIGSISISDENCNLHPASFLASISVYRGDYVSPTTQVYSVFPKSNVACQRSNKPPYFCNERKINRKNDFS